MAIVEDTGGFSGIIVAAHELGHLLGAVHDGSPPPSYLGGPGAVKCRWEDGYIMSDLRHTSKGFKWSICTVLQFHHFLKCVTVTSVTKSHAAVAVSSKWASRSIQDVTQSVHRLDSAISRIMSYLVTAISAKPDISLQSLPSWPHFTKVTKFTNIPPDSTVTKRRYLGHKFIMFTMLQRGDCHVYVQLSTRGGVPAQGAARQAAQPGRPVQEGQVSSDWLTRAHVTRCSPLVGQGHLRLLQGRQSLRPALLLRRGLGLLRVLQTRRGGIALRGQSRMSHSLDRLNIFLFASDIFHSNYVLSDVFKW